MIARVNMLERNCFIHKYILTENKNNLMLNKKSVLVLLILLITITAISSASASEISDDIGSDSGDEIELEENNDINEAEEADLDASGDDVSNDVLKDNDVEWKTFTELQQLIDDAEENSVIDLEYNYYYDEGFENYGVEINKNLTINGNYHALNGGEEHGILLLYGDEIVINELLIINGYDSGPGAGAYVTSDVAVFNYCGFINNKATDGNGGAVYTNGGTIGFFNCLFENNTAAGSGGAIYARNYLTYIDGCEFINNDVYDDGGAINTDGELLINSSYFEDNDAGLSGGAVYAYYPSHDEDSVLIANSVFYYNYAYGDTDENGEDIGGNGGAIYLDCFDSEGDFYNGAANSIIRNTTFLYNGAYGYGGALFNFQYTDISDCEFVENYVRTGGGGAIYMNNGITYQDNGQTFTQIFGLEIHGETTFIDNTAEKYGGAIKIYAYEPYLKKGIKGILKIYDDVLFEGNNVTNGNGGALSIVDSDSDVRDATFRNNHATKGGAVEGGNVVDCTFEGNSKPETLGTTVNGGNNGGNNNGGNNNGGNTQPSHGTQYNQVVTSVNLIPTPLSTTFDSGKTFQVRVVDSKTGNPISGFKVMLVIYTNGNYQTATITTNAYGIAQYGASTLSVGTHQVIVSNGQGGYFTAADQTSTITISKASCTIKAPAVKVAFKKSGKFKITVKNKANGKAAKGLKLSVKVYTGKKYKTYNVKTNAKGVASINTKKLTKGTHKVVITTKGGPFKTAKKTSKIKIK